MFGGLGKLSAYTILTMLLCCPNFLSNNLICVVSQVQTVLGDVLAPEEASSSDKFQIFLTASKKFEQLTPESEELQRLWTMATCWLNPQDVTWPHTSPCSVAQFVFGTGDARFCGCRLPIFSLRKP